uniref:DOMON domain-containing protein n=1 Tax=Meloidogyne incognita TaxID=6306 RepID=A0A914KNF8_MELIC
MVTRPSICIDNPKENILSPSTWEIVGTNPEPTMNRLLVFHLLPQKASRKRMLMINKGTGFPEYVVTKDHPEGPKCDEMSIIFSRRNYSLLFTPVSHTTTSTTKDPTDGSTSSSNIRDNQGQKTTKISTIKPSFKVGLGDHILQDGKVILAKGSMVAKKEDVEQYMASSADACDVDFDEGNIVLHYRNRGTTKDKGCTVDLLTNRKDEIVFWTGVHNRGGLYDCLNGSDINSNVLPFAYSLTNEEVKKFHNGPIFANRSCPSCLEGCVKKTGLEVSWQYDEDQGIDNAALYINPIGTKLLYYIRKEWNLSSTEVYFNQTHINQKVPKFHIKDLMRHRNSQPSTICMNNPKENILSPSTWEIVGTSPEPTMNRLLVFHLLPQKASRKRMLKNTRTGLSEYVVRKDHPEGPKCDEMSIIFSKDNYKLLTTSSITSTMKPTQGPTNKEETSTTSTYTSKNDKTISPSKETPQITKTLTAVSSLTTTITKATTTITTNKGSSGFLFFVVIIVIILAVIGIGIAIYFVIREGFDTEEEDNEAGDGTKEDVTGEDQEKEDIIGEDNNAKGEAQKIEDEEVKEDKDDVRGDDQKKEHVTGEEKNEDAKKDEQKKEDVKGEAAEDDNKAKEKIETTAKTVEDSASTNKGEIKEDQASAEDKNQEEKKAEI